MIVAIIIIIIIIVMIIIIIIIMLRTWLDWPLDTSDPKTCPRTQVGVDFSGHR